MRSDKQKAVTLRLEGKSYLEIQRELKIPKSTLCSWFSKLKISQQITSENISRSKKIWAHNITQFNHARAHKARLASEQIRINSSKEISFCDIDLKILGIALYWCEGYRRAKWTALFCNSDPILVKIMMKFFREICKVPEEKFRPQVQIHPNVSIDAAVNYWSKISGLDKGQFLKPLMQISIASKRKRPIHRLPFGTFRVGVADVKVFQKIKGWTDGLSKRFS